jgi:predicted methyltransferase
MRRIIAWLVAGLLGGLSETAVTALAPDVTVAVSDPARGKDMEADARRHPGELAAFAQIKPGDIVVDLIPGSGYFTRIFSRIVGPRGHVYAIWPKEYIKDDAEDVAVTEALAKDPHYDNVTLLMEPGAEFTVPVKADVVWTSQNYHDYPDKFMGRIDPKVLNDAVFKALKPGGVFVIIDHVADAGSGMRDTDTLHRIDPEIVKKQVVAAGFKFDGETAVLRNPADDHKKKVFDDSIRGHTDQFGFRFRKP